LKIEHEKYHFGRFFEKIKIFETILKSQKLRHKFLERLNFLFENTAIFAMKMTEICYF